MATKSTVTACVSVRGSQSIRTPATADVPLNLLWIFVLQFRCAESCIASDGLDLTESMLDATDVGSTARSPQECVDLVVAVEPTARAISFNSTAGACIYSTSIYGYDRRVDTQEPAFYLRTDNLTKKLGESDCFTTQDAEYLIAKLSFGDEQCVESTYDSLSGLCVSDTKPPFKLGRYDAGRLEDGTRYTLSRDKAIEAIDYECPDDDDDQMIFGDTWYCYAGLNVSLETDKPAVIKNNECEASLGSGSAPVKISEPREYGFVYDIWTFQEYTGHIYLGLYTTDYETSGDLYYYKYAWYDGSTATDLPWRPGRPDGELANNMVWVSGNCTVADDDGSDMELIVCKTPATYVAYDLTAKFL